MFTDILWFIGGAIMGGVFFLFGGLQILISLFCGFRFTAELNRRFRGQFNSGAIYSRYTATILLWSVVLAVVTYAVYHWLFGPAWYGYLSGAGFWFLISLGKWGINADNISDYMSGNARFMSNAMLDAFEAAVNELSAK